jgi:hypothetical protein
VISKMHSSAEALQNVVARNCQISETVIQLIAGDIASKFETALVH